MVVDYEEEFAYLDTTKGGSLELYDSWLKTPQKPKSTHLGVKSTQTGACSCVIWAKAQIGYTKSVGLARNWPITSQIPRVGAVVVTRESYAGHVAIITAIEGDNLILSEANYSRCRVTSGRKLPISSSLIIGYN